MSVHHTHVIRNVFVDMLDSIYAVLNSKLSRTLPFIIKQNFPFSNFHTSKILSQNILLSLSLSLSIQKAMLFRICYHFHYGFSLRKLAC